jgi:hypothetical protein
MDDLVVIILTLIIAGAGVIGQLKKKKQVDAAPSEGQKNPVNIWDLLREEAFPSVPKEVPEYLIVEQQESEPYENEQGYKFEAKNEGGVLINSGLKNETPAQEIIKKEKEGFSLRKAVIYSEILNRKYI